MTGRCGIVGIDELRPLLDRRKVIDAVRKALILQAEGRVQSPPPGHLLFERPHGDCHVKFGHVAGSRLFAVKVATGFYDNPKIGLPVNNGLILVLDANTGVPRVIFEDDGWLTAWRTAAATTLAAAALAPREIEEIGIVGTGLQARLAIEWLPEMLGDRPFAVWGRNERKTRAFASEFTGHGKDIRPVSTAEELLSRCNLVITATPSQVALFDSDLVRPGTHLVGVGADGPGKQELPVELFSRTAHITTDDHAQCLDHGDFGCAVRAGVVAENSDVMLGDLLSGRVAPSRRAEDITIADLTGIAAEDVAMAELFESALAGRA